MYPRKSYIQYQLRWAGSSLRKCTEIYDHCNYVIESSFQFPVSTESRDFKRRTMEGTFER